jgi:hypothetical protein
VHIVEMVKPRKMALSLPRSAADDLTDEFRGDCGVRGAAGSGGPAAVDRPPSHRNCTASVENELCTHCINASYAVSR